jgi:hypothetical protein
MIDAPARAAVVEALALAPARRGVVNISTLRAQKHAPPPGWSRETFERVTAAIAAAMVAAVRREDTEHAAHLSAPRSAGAERRIDPSAAEDVFRELDADGSRMALALRDALIERLLPW